MEVAAVERVTADACEPLERAEVGEVVSLLGLDEETLTGDTLGEPGSEVALQQMTFPEPVVSWTMEAESAEQGGSLGEALRRFAAEDPTLRVKDGPGLGQWTVAGMGELHLDIVRERLKTECGVSAKVGKPHVEYKDTILSRQVAERRFEKRMVDGTCYWAFLKLEVEPLAKGGGVELDCGDVRKRLPVSCQEALEQGLWMVLKADDGNGHPMTDMRVRALDVDYDARSMSELAFLNVARLALADAIAAAGRAEMEPVMLVEVSVPQDHLGPVIADLTARRGRVTEIDSLALGVSRIVALVPLSEMFGYASSLRSLSGGRGDVVAEPSMYAFRERGHK
jgi:elongation factor G